ncbi:MAG: NusG domain II-containing protein [Desulfotomaculaceae bacterium]|nr:NusG domain II-containing protein [Desulfotomaculaceae bacterium]
MQNLNRYLTAALLTLALISFGFLYLAQHRPAGEGLTIEIHKNGQLYRQMPLSEAADEEIKITDSEGHYNVVEIKDGQVRVKEADCPNQICVKTGWLSKTGQISFCAPNKLKVIIKGESNGVDATSY